MAAARLTAPAVVVVMAAACLTAPAVRKAVQHNALRIVMVPQQKTVLFVWDPGSLGADHVTHQTTEGATQTGHGVNLLDPQLAVAAECLIQEASAVASAVGPTYVIEAVAVHSAGRITRRISKMLEPDVAPTGIPQRCSSKEMWVVFMVVKRNAWLIRIVMPLSMDGRVASGAPCSLKARTAAKPHPALRIVALAEEIMECTRMS